MNAEYKTPPAPINSPCAFYDIYASVDDIGRSPTNPREIFDADKLASLTESIKQHGVLQAILIRPWPANYPHPAPVPKYELVAGERRWRAAKAAGFTSIPAKARELTDHEVLEIQVIENLQREDLHPIEEAIGYERMIENYGYTTEKLAEKIQKSKSYIYARIKLTALCHDARKAFREGRLNPSTALLIARIPTAGLQIKATREITDPDWLGDVMSVRKAQAHLQRNYMLKLLDAPFPINDALLIKTAGSCEHCPSRTGNAHLDLFDDVESADVCTNPECFAEKRQAHTLNVAKGAEAAGQTVITGEAARKIMEHGQYSSTPSEKSGLLALDSTCYDDKAHRTYREILADSEIETKLIENAHKGVMVEVAAKKQIVEALKVIGITRGADVREKQNKKIMAQVDAEKAYRQRLFDKISDRMATSFKEGGAEFTQPELTMLANTMFTGAYDEQRKRIMKIWQPDEKPESVHFHTFIDTLEAHELCLLMVDMCLVTDVFVSEHSLEWKPEKLLAAAARLSIDPAAIRKEITSELKTASKKTAAKAAPAGESTAAKPVAKKSAPAAAQATESTPAPDLARPTLKVKSDDSDQENLVERKSEEQELEVMNEEPTPADTSVPVAQDVVLCVGDRVVIKHGLKGMNGQKRKCCGREGVIEAITGAYIHVRTAPGVNGKITNLRMRDLEKLAGDVEEKMLDEKAVLA